MKPRSCFPALVMIFAAACSEQKPTKSLPPSAPVKQQLSEIVSSHHKFSINMPGDPKPTADKTPDGRDFTQWQTGDITTGGEFSLKVSSSRFSSGVPTKQELDLTRDAILKGFQATLKTETDWQNDGKLLGRRMNVKIEDLRLKGTIFYAVAHGKAYQINIIGQPNWRGWDVADQVIDSFKLLP
jgi:hypothetical protein